MSEEERRWQRIRLLRLFLWVGFCLAVAAFIWLQIGTYDLGNRQQAVGNIATGTRLHQIVLGESALLLVCTVAVLSLRRTLFTRIAILTIFIWTISLVDVIAFLQATTVIA